MEHNASAFYKKLSANETTASVSDNLNLLNEMGEIVECLRNARQRNEVWDAASWILNVSLQIMWNLDQFERFLNES